MSGESTKLWGGRFAAEPAAVFLDYSQSIDTDARMAAEDIWGSQAHVLMLGKQGILAPEEVREVLRYLEEARARVEAGTLQLDPADEDIHMNLEKFVTRGAGPEFGGKLHTARSRNDQVVTDSRLHLRNRLLDVLEALSGLQETLLTRAEGQERTVMPGYTHTQHAQPVSVAFWLTGHVAALQRDGQRLLAALDRADACPLGACALAGTSFPTDRALTARLLGFARVEPHALDAVGSRDIYLEALSALAILHAHLSRMSEELVLFSTYEFGMVELADALTSGSSIMPQKKNPCLAELARSRTGQMYGCLIQGLTMMKALISGYNRDIQEDKPPLWDALDLAEQSLGAVAAMVRTMELRTQRMRELVGANFATATELANWLVSDRGLPFRKCHEIVGALVRRLIEERKALGDVKRVAELLAGFGVKAKVSELGFLDPLKCLERQRSLGSTGPEETRRLWASLAEALTAAQREAASRRRRIARARVRTARAVRQVLRGAAPADCNL
jgi:argininosuccinate lyase